MNQTTPVTSDVVKQHGLSAEEYARILQLLGRAPNITELGIFSVMWSEHCSYKSSKIHLRKFPTTGPQVIQGPGENAGVVDIGDGQALAFKMESHNHPSFIEPFQGAATGVGGILRDVFTMGARPIANLNSLRFGAPSHPKTRHLLKGVVAGIGFYGNCVGIPTVGGEIYFDDCYNGNILVNAFTVGLIDRDKIFKGVAGGVGNPVVYVGSKTGRDGIHGATMASDVFGGGNEERRPTVQVGDPFTEKLLLEACLEVMKTGAVVGIQDMGAAGLTSSSFEMASRAGTGIEMDLDHVPRREEGMTPYEIMLSESQERMLMVVQKGREAEVLAVFAKWDLDAAVVGRVTTDGVMRVKAGGVTVVELPIAPLADAAPVYERPCQRPAWQDQVQQLDVATIPEPTDLNAALLKVLSSPNIASKRFAYRQYDQQVGTDTVVLPGSDAAVLRLKGTTKGIALTVDCNSRYCYLDPYWGGALAVAECARNIAASGARPLAITDCLNFGNPERPEIMWQFEQATLGISNACAELGTPVVSGNVSLYNETGSQAIYPTPTIGMVGVLADVRHHLTQYFKSAGDLIILLGETFPEIGGSEYLKVCHGKVAGQPPQLDFVRERNLHEVCRQASENGWLKSAHDLSEGGLVAALAECCISHPDLARHLGAQISLSTPSPQLFQRMDLLLFSESASRMLISLDPRHEEVFLKLAQDRGLPALRIGTVGGEQFRINGGIDIRISVIADHWWHGLERNVIR